MRTSVLAILLAGVAMPAFAADMPVKAPIREAVPYADWSGFYVGIEGGYGWGRQKWDGSSVFGGGSNSQRTFTAPTVNGRTGTADAEVFLPDFDTPLTSSLKNRGWVAGGHFGAQKQFGNWVLGLEGDADAANIKGDSNASTTGPLTLDSSIIFRTTAVDTLTVPGVTGPFPIRAVLDEQVIDVTGGARNATVTQSSSVNTKIDQLGTLRGKVGITNIFSPNIMIYGTGGLAWAHSETTLTTEQIVSGRVVAIVPGAGGAPVVGTVPFRDVTRLTAESSGYMFGWSVGAGVDWKITPNLILGALYLHYDFPKDTLAFTESGVRMGNSRQEVDVVKGRLSWLFPIQ